MSYFPFFMDIGGADGLIVGGGKVALRKAEKLLPYGPRITAAAPCIDPAFEALEGVCLLRAPFADEMLEGRAFVIAATDDAALNHRISALCREKKIPVNVVDDREACSFLFPSLVKAGEVSIGISTGGASPSAAIYLKEQIQALLPQGLEEIVAFLDELRPRFKAALPTEKERSRVYKELLSRCLALGRPLDGKELDNYLEEEGIGP